MSVGKIVLFAVLACTGDASAYRRQAFPMPTEALIILDQAHADDLLAQVSQLVRVTQRLPPRLLIVQGTDEDLRTIRSLRGVLGVFEDSVPVAVLQELQSTERTFAEAWIAGRKPKLHRRGEGLPWDAEGYQPPDAPDDTRKDSEGK